MAHIILIQKCTDGCCYKCGSDDADIDEEIQNAQDTVEFNISE